MGGGQSTLCDLEFRIEVSIEKKILLTNKDVKKRHGVFPPPHYYLGVFKPDTIKVKKNVICLS